MSWLSLLLLFTAGASIGSFISAFLWRFGQGRSVTKGRSHCPNCGIVLKWNNLIPLLSYIFQRGKCHHCRQSIAPRYPIIELAFGGAFLVYGLIVQPDVSFEALIGFYLLAIMLALFLFDLNYLILPDIFILPSIGLILLAAALGIAPISGLSFILASALTGFFAILYLLSRGRWIGFGDVKLVFLVGLVIGYPLALVAVVAAIWTGALIGIVLIVFKRGTLKTKMPLGSLIAASAIFFILFKQSLENFVRVIQ